MCPFVLILVCLASSGNGQRVQRAPNTQTLSRGGTSVRDASAGRIFKSSTSLAALLCTHNPNAAFQPSANPAHTASDALAFARPGTRRALRSRQRCIGQHIAQTSRHEIIMQEAASPTGERCTSWACRSLGSLACLEKQTEVVPTVGNEECQISVRAIGLNYADIFSVLGLYEAANKMLKETGGGTLVAGFEFAGEVVRTGKDVSSLKVGDRVYGFCRFGAYRTMVVAREEYVQKLPDGWTFAEGAALLAQGLTAWHGLVELGNAKKGSRVLVHSAAGGVGCAAMQICETLGCEAVGVVGTESKVAFLQDRFPSCKAIVRGPEGQYAKQLAELGIEYDVVLESLGGRYMTAALECVAPMGRLVHFGATHTFGGSPVDGLRKWFKLVPNFLGRPFFDPGALVAANRAVMGFNLVWLTERVDLLTQELNSMLTIGGLASRPPAVGKIFPFAELPKALDYLRSGASVGKVVVGVDEADGQAV